MQEAKTLGLAACRELGPAVRPHENHHRAGLRFSEEKPTKLSPRFTTSRIVTGWLGGKSEKSATGLGAQAVAFWVLFRRCPFSWPSEGIWAAATAGRSPYVCTLLGESSSLAEWSRPRGAREGGSALARGVDPAPRVRWPNVSIAQATIQGILGED